MEQYLYDTHVHTAEVSPCGRLPAARLVPLYLDAGYSGIVITDHLYAGLPAIAGAADWPRAVERYLAGYRRAREEGERLGLVVLWGVELTLRDGPAGDFLLFGLDEEFLLRHPRPFCLDLAVLHGLLSGRGALLYQAHPYRPGMGPAPPELLDGVEVCNTQPRNDSRNHLARGFAERHRLLQLAGGDTHMPEDVGRGGVRLPAAPRSNAELVALLRTPGAVTLHVDRRAVECCP